MRHPTVLRRAAALTLVCTCGMLLGAGPLAAAERGLEGVGPGDRVSAAVDWLRASVARLWNAAPTILATTDEPVAQSTEDDGTSDDDSDDDLDPGSGRGLMDPDG